MKISECVCYASTPPSPLAPADWLLVGVCSRHFPRPAPGANAGHRERRACGAFDTVSYMVQSVALPAQRGLSTSTGDGPPNITVLQRKALEEGSNLLFIGFIWGCFFLQIQLRCMRS